MNFTNVIRTERKGITGLRDDRRAATRALADLFAANDRSHEAALHCEEGLRRPCFYRYSMNAPTPPMQARLCPTLSSTRTDVSKGIAFLNSQPLGRFWSVGPEFTLYTPGPWLHAGTNDSRRLRSPGHRKRIPEDHRPRRLRPSSQIGAEPSYSNYPARRLRPPSVSAASTAASPQAPQCDRSACSALPAG